MKEWNLSSQLFNPVLNDDPKSIHYWLTDKDFKEFIRRLKKFIDDSYGLQDAHFIKEQIDKLAGEKLI